MLIEGEANELAAQQAVRRAEDERAHQQLQTIALGMDIQSFLESKVGKYLTARAEQERAVLMEQFLEIKPHDGESLRALQMRVAIIDRWQEWLGEALNAGHVAEQQFINEGKTE